MGRVYVGPALGFTSFYFTSPLSFLVVSFYTEFCWRCVYGWRRGMHGTRRRIQMASHLASLSFHSSFKDKQTSVSVEPNPVNCRQTNSSQVRRATGCFRWVGLGCDGEPDWQTFRWRATKPHAERHDATSAAESFEKWMDQAQGQRWATRRYVDPTLADMDQQGSNVPSMMLFSPCLIRWRGKEAEGCFFPNGEEWKWNPVRMPVGQSLALFSDECFLSQS